MQPDRIADRPLLQQQKTGQRITLSGRQDGILYYIVPNDPDGNATLFRAARAGKPNLFQYAAETAEADGALKKSMA